VNIKSPSMIKLTSAATFFCLTFSALPALSLTLTSQDIEHGKPMTKQQEFRGFGCNGGNQSPQLSWSDAPQGTKSFALTVYDPDAPTGSGWWHWQLVDIPADQTELKANAGIADNSGIPKGSQQIPNDYGIAAFGGACPPEGHGKHRYQFTLHALSVDKLPLPKNPSSALVGYMIGAHSLETTTLEASYRRDK
jgi:hypothetical protein